MSLPGSILPWLYEHISTCAPSAFALVSQIPVAWRDIPLTATSWPSLARYRALRPVPHPKSRMWAFSRRRERKAATTGRSPSKTDRDS